MRAEREQFKKDCAEWGISPDETVLGQLNAYCELLCARNRTTNLTAITAPTDVWKLHFLDSLALLREGVFDEARGRLIDIGAGAGFPGLVLKLFLPSWHMTLVDAQKKRVQFLNEAADLLFPGRERERIEIVHARAEDLARDTSYRSSFDVCTARAVSALHTLAEYALPFLKTGGIFAAYKSADCEEEIHQAQHAAKILGGQILPGEPYFLPQSDIGRRLVRMQKTEETDARYPRRAGIPEKRPL